MAESCRVLMKEPPHVSKLWEECLVTKALKQCLQVIGSLWVLTDERLDPLVRVDPVTRTRLWLQFSQLLESLFDFIGRKPEIPGNRADEILLTVLGQEKKDLII